MFIRVQHNYLFQFLISKIFSYYYLKKDSNDTVEYFIILYFRTRFLFILEIQYFPLFFLFQLNLPRPPGNITFEIPVRELYMPGDDFRFKPIYCKQTTKVKTFASYLILITAHILLMFIIRTVILLEITCCLSHLVCQLTLINYLFLF